MLESIAALSFLLIWIGFSAGMYSELKLIAIPVGLLFTLGATVIIAALSFLIVTIVKPFIG